MAKIISFLTPVALLLFTSSAHAGWYEIKNYVGTIGTASVHLSLQTYGYIDGGSTDHWRVGGSYYYDAHRIPIPLQGPTAGAGASPAKWPCCIVRGGAASFGSIDFEPMDAHGAGKLGGTSDTLSNRVRDYWRRCNGEWNDGKRTLPIVLHQVGSLNDTGSIAIPIAGVVEIPMWYHTKAYLLLGVYGSSEDCPVSMLHLRLVNIATVE